MKFVKRIFEDKETKKREVKNFATIREAAADIDTNMPEWKIQLLIADAIVNKKRAFKYKWEKVVN